MAEKYDRLLQADVIKKMALVSQTKTVKPKQSEGETDKSGGLWLEMA